MALNGAEHEAGVAVSTFRGRDIERHGKQPRGIEAKVGVGGRAKLVELQAADDDEGDGRPTCTAAVPAMEPPDPAAAAGFVLDAVMTRGRLNRSAGRKPNTTLRLKTQTDAGSKRLRIRSERNVERLPEPPCQCCGHGEDDRHPERRLQAVQPTFTYRQEVLHQSPPAGANRQAHGGL